VKGALKYSNACNAVKNIANTIVIYNPFNASFLAPATIAWCAQVTLAPELNNITVFNKGISQALNTGTFSGGQTAPISKVGDKLEWKNAQKNAKKNIISETINNIIPILSPTCTS